MSRFRRRDSGSTSGFMASDAACATPRAQNAKTQPLIRVVAPMTRRSAIVVVNRMFQLLGTDPVAAPSAQRAAKKTAEAALALAASIGGNVLAEPVVRWPRANSRLFGRWKSRSRDG